MSFWSASSLPSSYRPCAMNVSALSTICARRRIAKGRTRWGSAIATDAISLLARRRVVPGYLHAFVFSDLMADHLPCHHWR